MKPNDCQLCVACINYDPDTETCEVEGTPGDDCPDFESADDNSGIIETGDGEEWML